MKIKQFWMAAGANESGSFVHEEMSAANKSEASFKFKQKHGTKPEALTGPWFKKAEQLKIEYDEQFMDVMDRINALLKPYDLNFQYVDEEHNGAVVYRFIETEK